jgi:hypothetical protein
MPMGKTTVPKAIDYSDLSSLNIRELVSLKIKLSEKISETRSNISQLEQEIIQHKKTSQGTYPAGHPWLEKLKELGKEYQAELEKLAILEMQHSAVVQELGTRNKGVRE